MNDNNRSTGAADTDHRWHNSVFNSAADVRVYHALLDDIKKFAPEKLVHLQRGGIGNGLGRTEAQAQQMLDKIPASQRAGVDGSSAAAQMKEYLADKDASHITPHSKGGSSHPDNIKWENRSANRVRGDRPMTDQEQMSLDIKAQFDNLTGALEAGVQAAPRGAVIGVVTTAPLSMLKNGLSVVRGEISPQEAASKVVKEVAIGGGVGAVTAFSVTTVATACPPIAIALAAVSPALLVVGGVGMIYEFFQILDDHKQQVKIYYESLTQNELQYLCQIEDEMIRKHEKNLQYLAQNKALSDSITSRPLATGIQAAFEQYCESVSMVESLGFVNQDKKLLNPALSSVIESY